MGGGDAGGEHQKRGEHGERQGLYEPAEHGPPGLAPCGAGGRRGVRGVSREGDCVRSAGRNRVRGEAAQGGGGMRLSLYRVEPRGFRGEGRIRASGRPERAGQDGLQIVSGGVQRVPARFLRAGGGDVRCGGCCDLSDRRARGFPRGLGTDRSGSRRGVPRGLKRRRAFDCGRNDPRRRRHRSGDDRADGRGERLRGVRKGRSQRREIRPGNGRGAQRARDREGRGVGGGRRRSGRRPRLNTPRGGSINN